MGTPIVFENTLFENASLTKGRHPAGFQKLLDTSTCEHCRVLPTKVSRGPFTVDGRTEYVALCDGCSCRFDHTAEQAERNARELEALERGTLS